MGDTTVKRSPTETLMHCLEEFGKEEAVECMVIWTDESGDICWSCSTDSQVTKLGMVGFVGTLLAKRVE